MDLRPRLERLDRLVLRSEGLDPEGLSFAFRPLWQLDAPGQASVALAKAQASAVYAGLGLWPAAVTARLVEAQVAADGAYPNAEAVFAAARAADAPVPGAAAPAPAPAPGAAPTRDFDPAQPRAPDGRWTAGGNEAGTMTGPSGMSLDPAQSRDPIGAFSPRGGVTFGHQARGEPADLTARDPVEQAMVRQATVALAPFILASWLRQRAGEAVGALARGLSNWFAAGLPPDPPPSAQPVGLGVREPVPSDLLESRSPGFLGSSPHPGTAIPTPGSFGPEGNFTALNQEAQGPVKADPRAAQKLDNVLSDYDTRRYDIGNQQFQLDKGGMRHILERHAPEYWDGSVARTQTFFPRGTTIAEIKEVVMDVLNQNRADIVANPDRHDWKFSGTSGGSRYEIAGYQGRVTHVVPLVQLK